jgi:hypothetical protein
MAQNGATAVEISEFDASFIMDITNWGFTKLNGDAPSNLLREEAQGKGNGFRFNELKIQLNNCLQ